MVLSHIQFNNIPEPRVLPNTLNGFPCQIVTGQVAGRGSGFLFYQNSNIDGAHCDTEEPLYTFSFSFYRFLD